MTTYVIRYKGEPPRYNRGLGYETTLAEATQYSSWHDAKEKCAELCDVEGVYEYEVEIARAGGGPLTRAQLIQAIQAAKTSTVADGVRIIYVDAELLIKAIQELS